MLLTLLHAIVVLDPAATAQDGLLARPRLWVLPDLRRTLVILDVASHVLLEQVERVLPLSEELSLLLSQSHLLVGQHDSQLATDPVLRQDHGLSEGVGEQVRSVVQSLGRLLDLWMVSHNGWTGDTRGSLSGYAVLVT